MKGIGRMWLPVAVARLKRRCWKMSLFRLGELSQPFSWTPLLFTKTRSRYGRCPRGPLSRSWEAAVGWAAAGGGALCPGWAADGASVCSGERRKTADQHGDDATELQPLMFPERWGRTAADSPGKVSPGEQHGLFPLSALFHGSTSTDTRGKRTVNMKLTGLRAQGEQE